MTETPAETLRRAAEKLRGLAQAATEGPWATGKSGLSVWVETADRDLFVADVGDQGNEFAEADGAFIAAMHPGVTLLIADQWDAIAADMEILHATVQPYGVVDHSGQGHAAWASTLTAARAFLGEVTR